MARNSLESLLSGRLGNHSTRKDMLGESTFPGLTIDNLPSTSISGGSVEQQLAGMSEALSASNAAQQSELEQDLQASTRSTTTSSTSSSSIGSDLEGAASSLLGGVFGIAPVVQGLFSLFGGGSGGDTQQSLVPFTLPNSIQYAAGVNGPGSAAAPIDYGQGGQARSLATPASAATGSSSSQAGQTVQVNVSAMDSQSFLDHSNDIADAVRSALLNSHPLTDVIASL